MEGYHSRRNGIFHNIAACLHKKFIIFLLAGVILLLGAYLGYCISFPLSGSMSNLLQKIHDSHNTTIHWDQIYKILPPEVKDCKKLLPGKFNYSTSYLSRRKTFEKMFSQVTKRARFIEGHSGQVSEQWKLYYALSQMDFVTNVCEIGFNGGHSTLQWLASNPRTVVFSFDLGKYNYTHKMATYFKSEFGKRFNIVFGNSKATVPVFKQLLPHILCDLLVIDGGHTYDTAKADLTNMMALANPQHHLLIFDDYPSRMSNYMKVLGRAWTESKQKGHVVEIFSCAFGASKGRGFSVGKYILSRK